jgi:hypothetical protein
MSGLFPAILKGLQHSAQGWRAERLPWVRCFKTVSTLKGLHPFMSRFWYSVAATLSGLLPFLDITQGSSQARNPGLSDEIPLGFKVGFQQNGAKTKTRRSLFVIRHFPSWT